MSYHHKTIAPGSSAHSQWLGSMSKYHMTKDEVTIIAFEVICVYTPMIQLFRTIMEGDLGMKKINLLSFGIMA